MRLSVLIDSKRSYKPNWKQHRPVDDREPERFKPPKKSSRWLVAVTRDTSLILFVCSVQGRFWVGL